LEIIVDNVGMNDLSSDFSFGRKLPIAILDGLAIRSHFVRLRRSRRAIVTSVARTLAIVAILGAIWQAAGTWIPLPSRVLGDSLGQWLPFLPIAMGLWLIYDANRRSSETDDAEFDLIDAELEGLRRELENS
jgi:hypothetical protein